MDGGATSLSVGTGAKLPLSNFQPQAVGSKETVSSNSFHSIICKCTRSPFKYAALSDGASFSGWMIPSESIWRYFEYLKYELEKNYKTNGNV